MWLHLFLVKIHSLEPSPPFQHCLCENLYQLTLPVSEPSIMLPLGNDCTMLQVDQLIGIALNSGYVFWYDTIHIHFNRMLNSKCVVLLYSSYVGVWACSLPSAQQACRSLSPCPRSTITSWHTNTCTIQCSFFHFIC